MDLIIFYENGTTLRFEQVRELKENDGTLEFRYFGVSTQQERKGMFKGFVGYSVSQEKQSPFTVKTELLQGGLVSAT